MVLLTAEGGDTERQDSQLRSSIVSSHEGFVHFSLGLLSKRMMLLPKSDYVERLYKGTVIAVSKHSIHDSISTSLAFIFSKSSPVPNTHKDEQSQK